MSYLEQSEAIIAEIKVGFHLQQGVIIGESDKTVTSSVGSFDCQTLGGERLYLAAKRPKPDYFSHSRQVSDIRQAMMWQFTRLLALEERITEEIPVLRIELPYFQAALINSDGDYVGQLTEDFTQAGRHSIWGVKPRELDPNDQSLVKLCKMLRRASIQDIDVANMFFWTKLPLGPKRRRLGDLDKALMHFTARDRIALFPDEAISASLSAYQVRDTSNL